MRSIPLVLFITSSVFAFSPDYRSFYLAVDIGGIGLHWSTIANEEKNFSDFYGFYLYSTDSLGHSDTTSFEYYFHNFSVNVKGLWYFMEHSGAGLFYQYESLSERVKNITHWKPSNGFLKLHKIGPIFSYWPELLRDIGISFTIPLGFCFGSLNRLPLLTAHYDNQNNATRQLLSYVNKRVVCLGFSTALSIDIHVHIFVHISPSYEVSFLMINDDHFGKHPELSCNQGLSIKCGISFLSACR